jgi:hypothetical protein
MGMEHRCGTRRRIDASVIVDCRPVGLVRARIQNIGVGGLYLKMRPVTGIANDRVRIIFMRRDRGVYRLYRMPAVVIRWTREGAGLMFSELASTSFYALLAILLAEERRTAAEKVATHRTGATNRKPGGSWFKQ